MDVLRAYSKIECLDLVTLIELIIQSFMDHKEVSHSSR